LNSNEEINMSDESRDSFDYPGDEVVVEWDGRLCIHVGECSRAEGELFVGGRKPWCQPNLVSIDEVVEVVERCPTGALVYRRADGKAEKVSDRNTVVVSNNGPLYLRGELEIEGAGDDMPGVRFRAALCRCGESKNKPYCDNSHEAAGFVDRGAIGERGDGYEAPGGPLKIQPMKDGPVVVSGNLEMVAGSGRVAWRGTKAALCRCGASDNKPFCDGSHRGAGFTSD
jgi:CDGSH-type Zn-finger protein/uncharacterized Fe-S cluster protein YjdI